jgi:hypothetical protein
MKLIRVMGWEKYQHYKDRNPPWIKLHRELLTSNTWVSLDDAGRVLAIAIMMLAAATGNRIKAEPRYLMRVAYLNAEPDLRPLVEVGFIEIIDENSEHASSPTNGASAMLATARPETEQIQNRAEKKEVEARVPRSAPKRGSRLPEGWSPSVEGIAFSIKCGLNTDATLAAFRDYWTAASGEKASKLDWDAAWRTWCRKSVDFARNKPSPPAARGAYAAPATDDEARRLAGYAEMIKKRIPPGQKFSSADRFKLIRDGLVTMEDCEKAGCAA